MARQGSPDRSKPGSDVLAAGRCAMAHAGLDGVHAHMDQQPQAGELRSGTTASRHSIPAARLDLPQTSWPRSVPTTAAGPPLDPPGRRR
ncbi:hypothetical protein ACF1BN_21945 [Streptomyces sp. NPDC014861]|uniref:hypothetical protein n=1 Tax=Streptomyces sp. NPDC014861 TaxID=3364923 RepID=UPI0036FAA2A6